jgi:DNA mismatch repair protein MutS2
MQVVKQFHLKRGFTTINVTTGMLILFMNAETFFFDRILTDIDNQSIENHLSTYSYRLNMNYFLKKCNSKKCF